MLAAVQLHRLLTSSPSRRLPEVVYVWVLPVRRDLWDYKLIWTFEYHKFFLCVVLFHLWDPLTALPVAFLHHVDAGMWCVLFYFENPTLSCIDTWVWLPTSSICSLIEHQSSVYSDVNYIHTSKRNHSLLQTVWGMCVRQQCWMLKRHIT